MFTVVCSAKGSPGVTTATLALAAAWPAQSPVVAVEADPAGGDLGIRIKTREGALPPSPTVATLAASARDGGADVVRRHAIALNDRVNVIPGYLEPEQGRAIDSLWRPLARVLRDSDIDTIVDVGRINSSSPAMQLVEAADAVVVVLQADVASLLHTRERVRHLIPARPGLPVVPLVVSRDRDAAADRGDVDHVLAAARLQAQPALHLAWDPAAVQALEQGESPASRSLVRSKLIRSGQVVADRLIENRTAGVLKEAL